MGLSILDGLRQIKPVKTLLPQRALRDKGRVYAREDGLTTTSIVLAELFGKKHRNVLRSIDLAIEQTPPRFWLKNFKQDNYVDACGRNQPMYRMSNDGFAFVAVRFTGTRAMSWQIDYIESKSKTKANQHE
jgi:Rha family phage regulatory protein